MKRIYIHVLYVLLATSLLWATGCYKDKGNYTFTQINKVAITDPLAATSLSFKISDTIRLNPVVNQSTETTTDSLAYKWKMYELRADGAPSPYIDLATTKSLTLPVEGPLFMLGGVYRLLLEVTDKKTGIASYLFYTLNIVNEFAQGWLLLEEIGTKGDLSMVLPDGRIVRNLYSILNKTQLDKPVRIDLTTRNITEDLSPTGKRLYVLSENSGVELDYQTLGKKFDYQQLFFEPPTPIKPEFLSWTSSSGIAINDGKVHANLVGGFPGVKKWGPKLLSPAGNFDYYAAPFVAGGTTYVAVMYDNIHKRFSYVSSGVGGASTGLTAFPGTASDPAIFDMNNVGMTMLFMDSSVVLREYNAIMKDGSNTPYLLRFKTTVATGSSPVVTLAKVQMNAPEIVDMTSAAGSTSTPHIYYSVGNKLYRYETTSNTTTQPYSFAAGEVVTKLEYQRVVPGASYQRLVATTWNGTEGKLYFFELSAVGDFSNYSHVYTGFSKIIDLAYKIP